MPTNGEALTSTKITPLASLAKYGPMHEGYADTGKKQQLQISKGGAGLPMAVPPVGFWRARDRIKHPVIFSTQIAKIEVRC